MRSRNRESRTEHTHGTKRELTALDPYEGRHGYPPSEEFVHDASGDPQLGGEWERIITTIFTIDERKTFDRLTSELSFGDGAHRREYSEIFDALDIATTRTDEASRLYVNAKVALATYLAEVASYESDMREQARTSLEDAKQAKASVKGAKGSGGKAITEADVVARMAKIFPDEYRRIETTKARAEEAVGHMKRLLERWEERTRALDAMLRSSRKM